MTLQQLKYVIVIAETGTLSRAAERIFVAQPSLSNSLKELETELGFLLFTRNNRGLVLTPQGEEFLAYARQVIEQYALLEGRFVRNQGQKKRFALSTQHYSFVVEAFIQLVQQGDLDSYDFALRETETQNVIQDVRKLRSELGILHLNSMNHAILTRMFLDSGLSFHPLISCEIYVYLSKNSPLASQDCITLAELQDYPYLSFDLGGDSSFYYAEEVLSTQNYQKTIRATDRATMLNLMKGLHGFTLCSGVISQTLNGDDYVAIPLESSEQMHIGYIKKTDLPLSDWANTFLQLIEPLLKGKK